MIIVSHCLCPLRKISNSADNLTMIHICPLKQKKSLEPYGFKMLSTVKLLDYRQA